MVQAFDRLVRRPAALIALAPLLLAGCQCLWPAAATGEDASADAGVETSAAPACPDVTSAEAWVNRTPTIGEAPTKLIVSLKVADKMPWMLKPVSTEEVGVLALEIVPGGNSVPGNIGYRQQQPSPLPESIRILCGGDDVAIIDEILVVQ